MDLPPSIAAPEALGVISIGRGEKRELLLKISRMLGGGDGH